MFATLTLSIFCCLAIDVEVRTVDGELNLGSLMSLDARQVELAGPDGTLAVIPIDAVLSLSRSPARAMRSDAGTTHVGLTCGSRLVVDAIDASAGATQLTSRNGDRYQVDLKQVHTVRFNPHSALDRQWNDILGSDLVADVVVIRRNAESLDYLEGVVRGLTADAVVFEYEGDLIEVAHSKLEGVVFLRGSETHDAAIKLTTTAGSLLHLTDLHLADDSVLGETFCGVSVSVPLEHLWRVDFAEGKVLYLGDVTPHRVEVCAAGPSTVQSQAVERLLYQPRSNQALFGGKLALRMPADEGIKLFERGLAVHSRTEITYRLDGEFRRLRTLAGMDPHSATRGLVKLEIFNGSTRIFSEVIAAGADPVLIDVDVTGARRLRLLVDYADNWDLSDHLNLCNLRVTK